MSNTIRIDFEGKSYELKPKTITGALLEEIAPIRAKQRNLSQMQEITQAAMEDASIFALVDPTSGGLREDVSQADFVAAMSKNAKLLKAVQAPTIELHTSADGIALMADIIRKTVDRSKFSRELDNAIDSPAEDTITNGEAMKRSEFWSNFDVTVMIDYVETFCRRARI